MLYQVCALSVPIAAMNPGREDAREQVLRRFDRSRLRLDVLQGRRDRAAVTGLCGDVVLVRLGALALGRPLGLVGAVRVLDVVEVEQIRPRFELDTRGPEAPQEVLARLRGARLTRGLGDDTPARLRRSCEQLLVALRGSRSDALVLGGALTGEHAVAVRDVRRGDGIEVRGELLPDLRRQEPVLRLRGRGETVQQRVVLVRGEPPGSVASDRLRGDRCVARRRRRVGVDVRLAGGDVGLLAAVEAGLVGVPGVANTSEARAATATQDSAVRVFMGPPVSGPSGGGPTSRVSGSG